MRRHKRTRLPAGAGISPEPPKEPTLFEKVKRWAENNPQTVSMIILAAIFSFLLPNMKPIKEFFPSPKDRLVIYNPAPPISVVKGQAENFILYGKHLQGVTNEGSVTANIAGVKITEVRPAVTSDGKEEITFRLDASNAAVGSYKITVENDGQKSTLPFTVTAK